MTLAMKIDYSNHLFKIIKDFSVNILKLKQYAQKPIITHEINPSNKNLNTNSFKIEN